MFGLTACDCGTGATSRCCAAAGILARHDKTAIAEAVSIRLFIATSPPDKRRSWKLALRAEREITPQPADPSGHRLAGGNDLPTGVALAHIGVVARGIGAVVPSLRGRLAVVGVAGRR